MAALLKFGPRHGVPSTTAAIARLNFAVLENRTGTRARAKLSCHWFRDTYGRLSCHWGVDAEPARTSRLWIL
jgi:hypothetical protein